MACHAWRHEQWAELDGAAEVELLERATRALSAIGLPPLGFRPPGGRLNAGSAAALQAAGYRYVSPLGESPGVNDGLAVLPFRWEHVDAWHCFPRLGGLRGRLVGEGSARDAGGLPPRLASAAFRAAVRGGAIGGAGRLRATMLEQIDAVARDGGYAALVFHPFLLGWRRTWSAMGAVLERAAELAARGTLRVATMADVSESVQRAR